MEVAVERLLSLLDVDDERELFVDDSDLKLVLLRRMMMRLLVVMMGGVVGALAVMQLSIFAYFQCLIDLSCVESVRGNWVLLLLLLEWW